MQFSPLHVQHNIDQQRFECTVDDLLCVADYQRSGNVMHMTHTEVPPALAGQGIAAALVAAALEHARSAKLKVNPACSYVRLYMQRHPETQSLRA
jgi:uncharacterized protein